MKKSIKKFLPLLILVCLLFVLVGCKKEYFRFKEDSLTVYIDEPFELNWEGYVKKKKNRSFDFQIKDNTIVKYDEETGKFIAIKEGETEITGVYGKMMDSIKIYSFNRIAPELPTIDIVPNRIEGFVGDKITVAASVNNPGVYTDLSIDWTLSNNKAHYEDGSIVLDDVGEVKLTATLKANIKVSKSVNITIRELDPILSVNPFDTIIDIDSEFQLVYSTEPKFKEVNWKSNNEEVVTVTKDGLVKAVGIGKTKLVATILGSNVTKQYDIEVRKLIRNLEANIVDSYEVNDISDIIVIPSPSDCTENNFSIECSNDSVLTITKDPLTGIFTLKALKEGDVTLTVRALDGSNFVKEFNVHVYKVEYENCLVDQNAINYTYGTTIEFEGKNYVYGKSLFSTINEAIQATSKNVICLPGEYTEDVNINIDNINLYGAFKDVDPRNEDRGLESIIKGKIKINNNVKNIVINGFAFTDKGCIDVNDYCENIKLIYNYIYNTNADAADWIEGREELEAVFDFWSASNVITNLEVQYNRFENVKETCVYFARNKNVIANNNVFHNFKGDAIRVDGLVNLGHWEFKDNDFINDALSGYNGIYLNSISGKDEDGIQSIDITGNIFKNIGETSASTSYTCAISCRKYQEKGITLNILYNQFFNCYNYLNIRNNGAKADTYICNINYNMFVGVPTGVYFRNITPGTSESSTTNPYLANMDLNYYEDSDRNAITNLIPYEGKFLELKSYKFNFESYVEFVSALTDRNVTLRVIPEEIIEE